MYVCTQLIQKIQCCKKSTITVSSRPTIVCTSNVIHIGWIQLLLFFLMASPICCSWLLSFNKLQLISTAKAYVKRCHQILQQTVILMQMKIIFIGCISENYSVQYYDSNNFKVLNTSFFTNDLQVSASRHNLSL